MDEMTTRRTIDRLIAEAGPKPPWWRLRARRRWHAAIAEICELVVARADSRPLGATTPELDYAIRHWKWTHHRGPRP